ncbi:MAG: hypothetical protein HC921_11390 [Synechococcaceae cyanobacterium SM2_3_1]|nr:hypothetical protein [Synechococcaceae cyanobacterium SM2_3_1]
MSQTKVAADLPAEELKIRIKKLNSKAGQMKMDLHDLAEGLPADYELLMDLASRTYEVYQQLQELKRLLKQKDRNP